MTPFCSTVALPDDDPFATSAITWVSLQLSTTPFKVPNHTAPGDAPKPDPVMVTCVPGTPPADVTFVMVVVFRLNVTALDNTPPCCTCAVPDCAFEATVA